VGVKQMDNQHKKFIAIINDFYDAVSEGQEASAIQKAVDGLVNYIKIHFADEEVLMQKYNFPQLEPHKRIHKYLTNNVNEYAEKLKSGQKIISLDMAFFLKGWLEDHIGETDKKYGLYITGQK
jgi:hemerythrin